jgi:hypothetical protein
MVNLMAVSLDDFKVLLEMEFLNQAKMIHVPFIGLCYLLSPVVSNIVI